MRMTMLVENECLSNRGDLTAEFGLSMLIERGDERILFDTGSTGVFVDNASALDVDLGSIDWVVISHHHFDHAGGLERFFHVNSDARVHWVRVERAERYASMFHIIRRSIGVDWTLYERFPNRFLEFEESLSLSEGVDLLADIPADYPLPKGNKILFAKRDGRFVPDSFDHELTMVIRESDGMVVFTGCAHSGVLNMVSAATRRFPDVPVKGIVGGFHLMGLPLASHGMSGTRREVKEIGAKLGELCAGPIYTGHCTGAAAFEVLRDVLGDRLRPFPTGTVFEI